MTTNIRVDQRGGNKAIRVVRETRNEAGEWIRVGEPEIHSQVLTKFGQESSIVAVFDSRRHRSRGIWGVPLLTSNVELKRTHEGKLEMYVSDVPALNTTVLSVNNVNGDLVAIVSIPLKDVTVGERDNVLPFSRPTHRNGGQAA